MIPLRDQNPLTARQTDILQQMADGLSYRDIADNLDVSPSTIKNQASHIMSRLKQPNSRAAVAEALRHTWIV